MITFGRSHEPRRLGHKSILFLLTIGLGLIASGCGGPNEIPNGSAVESAYDAEACESQGGTVQFHEDDRGFPYETCYKPRRFFAEEQPKPWLLYVLIAAAVVWGLKRLGE